MKVLISGSSGLVGTALLEKMKELGYVVKKLVRKRSDNEDEIYWDPYMQEINPKEIEGFNAFVNLSGENIANGRWTERKKKAIRESRVKTTHFLSMLTNNLEQPPEVLVNASAIGFYGNNGAEWVTEESPAGSGFLAQVCKDWEEAAEPAADNSRIVFLRTGIVLTRRGGALSKMEIPFKLGLGGRIGSGEQYLSWIALDDLVNIIVELIQRDCYQGPVNAVSPEPLTNREFTEVLGKVLHRPTWIPLPAGFLRFSMGEMADEMFLASQRVKPEKLLDNHFHYRHTNLENFLREEFN